MNRRPGLTSRERDGQFDGGLLVRDPDKEPKYASLNIEGKTTIVGFCKNNIIYCLREYGRRGLESPDPKIQFQAAEMHHSLGRLKKNMQIGKNKTPYTLAVFFCLSIRPSTVSPENIYQRLKAVNLH